jgi:hypothetical protein
MRLTSLVTQSCRLDRAAGAASKALWEISWGRPKDYDPKADENCRKPTFDPSLYTLEELKQLYAAMKLVALKQGLIPPEEGEDVIG